MANPGMTPDPSVCPEDIVAPTPGHYRGLRRLPFICITVGAAIVQLIGQAMGAYSQSSDGPVRTVFHLIGIAPLIAVSYRLKNMGLSTWWALVLFILAMVWFTVPAVFLPGFVVGTLAAIGLMACPEGYSDTRRLDRAGIIIMCVAAAAIILPAITTAIWGWPS